MELHDPGEELRLRCGFRVDQGHGSSHEGLSPPAFDDLGTHSSPSHTICDFDIICEDAAHKGLKHLRGSARVAPQVNYKSLLLPRPPQNSMNLSLVGIKLRQF